MPLPEYTMLTLISIVAVILLELLWLRSGVFRRPSYWIAIAICTAFQVPVDGWLTKLSNPIVQYAPEHHSGVRWPWDIPVEDFGFGWSMMTLTIIVWILAGRWLRDRSDVPPAGRAAPASTEPASTTAPTVMTSSSEPSSSTTTSFQDEEPHDAR